MSGRTRCHLPLSHRLLPGKEDMNMELLAPAGNPQALKAAIANGADAVYLGGRQFSARQSADNFTNDQIKEALLYAHLHQRKIYLTLNTLLDKKELFAALDDVYDLYRQGIDAVIVQDFGLLKALRQVLPGLRVHASTQMTIHNREGCEVLKELGVRRVVLAREMRLKEIEQIKKEVQDLELEVFVHGALCYSYSGQCLFSSMVGGRSGNRGRCAQPCRLLYRMVGEEGRPENEAAAHLLSLTDLCLLEQLPLLEQAGVSSLKIEGRMKRPEYVAVVTRVYRQALDHLQENGGVEPDREAARGDLLKIFNRTFSSGYLLPESGGLLSSKRPNNRGIPVGRVLEQDPGLQTRIKLSAALREGDGLEIWVSRGANPALVVKNMQVDGVQVEKADPGCVVSLGLNGRAAPGDRVFKTHDQQLIAQALKSFQGPGVDRIPLDVEARLQSGQPLHLRFRDPQGFMAEVDTVSPAEPAEQHPLDKLTLESKLDRLGNTPYRLRRLEWYNDAGLMVPFSEINQARRSAVEQLLSLRVRAQSRTEPEPIVFARSCERLRKSRPAAVESRPSRLSVWVSGPKEARAAFQAGAERVYLGLEGLGSHKKLGIRNVISIVEEARSRGAELVPALPRIQKPGELDTWQPLIDEGIHAMMAGNLGGVKWCLDRGLQVFADYSLNVFNPLSLDYLVDLGVKEACLSPELDSARLQEFAPANRGEILVHGDVLLMLSECCIMKEMQAGQKNGCRMLCRRKGLGLQDEKGYRFPLATDDYCRLYLFNSRTLCLMENLNRILHLKPAGIRVDMKLEGPEQAARVVSLYRKALDSIARGQRPDLEGLRRSLVQGRDRLYTRGHFLRGVQ